jgi:hypothetical protein
MKKKTKKIPSLPKYNWGGWGNIAQSAGQMGMGIAANQDLEGEDKQRANEMAMNTAANQGLQKIPGYGQFHGLAMGASNLGRSTIAKDEKGYATTRGGQIADNFMNPTHQQITGDLSKGQYGEAALSAVFNKGVASTLGGIAPETKFGEFMTKFGRGEKVFAMGGMNMMPNAEVEGNEMITSNTPPQTFGAGGIELTSNNPYGTPTYKTYGPSHDNGGIPVNMTPGTIINGKTVNFLTGNKFTKDIDAVAKMENKYTKKAENGDKFAAKTANLILPVLAQKKDYLNKLQNAIIANKEQAKALRNGELPFTDNEQVEPQSEMPMAKYGGMYANGGKLPEGILKARLESHMSPKEANNYIANYAKGGIHINPANKGKFTASAERAGMGVQEFARHVLANKEDYSSTQVKRANFAHNAAGWKHEMGGVQLPYYNIDSNGNPIYTMGGGYPAMTNPYHNFKGSIPMYMKGGMLPKFEDGNVFDEENPFGYKPQNLAEQYKINLANTNRNAYKNDEQTNEDRMALNNFWNSVLASKPQNNTPSSNLKFSDSGVAMTKMSDLDETDLPEIKLKQTTRKEFNKRNPQLDNDKLNWGKIGSQVSMGLLQNAGNIYNLSRYNKPEVEKYDRIMANLLNPKAAIRDVDVEGRLAEKNIKDASAGNIGSYLSNRTGLASKIAQGKEKVRMNYDNANAGILTDAQKFNAQVAMQEAIANAQNRARVRSGKGEAIAGIGQNIAGQFADTKKGDMDQKTLQLFMQYYNNPQFRDAMKKAGYNIA